MYRLVAYHPETDWVAGFETWTAAFEAALTLMPQWARGGYTAWEIVRPLVRVKTSRWTSRLEEP